MTQEERKQATVGVHTKQWTRDLEDRMTKRLGGRRGRRRGRRKTEKERGRREGREKDQG